MAGFGFVSRGSRPRNQNFLLSFSVSCRSLKNRVRKFDCQFLIVGHFKKMWMNDSSGCGGALDKEQKVQARVGLAAKCDVLVLMPKMLL
jgi:hypothetical protein